MSMRILFAAADRDLLLSYRKLLDDAVGETVAAFDGAQVLTLTADEDFDVLVLDSGVPRVEYTHIVQRMTNAGTPVIVLLNEPIGTQLLLGTPLANAYLAFPFRSGELIALIRDVTEKAASGERFVAADAEVDVAQFRLTNGPRLTAAEIDLLRLLGSGNTVDAATIGVYISALNGKLDKINSRARVRYRAGEGYQLVTLDE